MKTRQNILQVEEPSPETESVQGRKIELGSSFKTSPDQRDPPEVFLPIAKRDKFSCPRHSSRNFTLLHARHQKHPQSIKHSLWFGSAQPSSYWGGLGRGPGVHLMLLHHPLQAGVMKLCVGRAACKGAQGETWRISAAQRLLLLGEKSYFRNSAGKCAQ